MNAPATKIGLIASPTDRIVVERNGEQIALKQGDAILAGDLIQNQDIIPVDIELPAQTTGQADSLITLAPEAAARVGTTTGQDGVSTLLEVTSVTDGVELYALGDGANGAVLVADASGGSFSGLIGSGVLAGGGSALSSGAAMVGGAAGLAAVASSSGDSATSTSTSPAASTNEDSSSTGSSTTGSSTANGSDPQATNNMHTSTPADNQTGDQTGADTNGDTATADPTGPDFTSPEGVAEFVQSLPEQNPQDAPAILESTITDVVTQITDALGISSGAMPSDNPLAMITDNLPTGIM